MHKICLYMFSFTCNLYPYICGKKIIKRIIEKIFFFNYFSNIPFFCIYEQTLCKRNKVYVDICFTCNYVYLHLIIHGFFFFRDAGSVCFKVTCSRLYFKNSSVCFHLQILFFLSLPVSHFYIIFSCTAFFVLNYFIFFFLCLL